MYHILPDLILQIKSICVSKCGTREMTAWFCKVAGWESCNHFPRAFLCCSWKCWKKKRRKKPTQVIQLVSALLSTGAFLPKPMLEHTWRKHRQLFLLGSLSPWEACIFLTSSLLLIVALNLTPNSNFCCPVRSTFLVTIFSPVRINYSTFRHFVVFSRATPVSHEGKILQHKLIQPLLRDLRSVCSHRRPHHSLSPLNPQPELQSDTAKCSSNCTVLNGWATFFKTLFFF